MSKVLSLILPIYNVEKYLARCLDSIYSQGVNEDTYEVIAIIDGSPDNSIVVAKDYALLHKNLVIIDKENGGVSSARNIGIEKSEGEYIMFVDPDDTLMPNSLQKVIDTISFSNADIAIFRAFNEGTNSEISAWKGRINENIPYTGLEAYEKVGTQSFVWGAAYNRSFWHINKFAFALNVKNSEDSILFIQCQIKAKQMMFCDISLYSVLSRPESASHDITPQRLTQWFEALKLVKKIKKEECKTPIETAMLDGLNYSIISNITNNAIRVMGWKAKKFLYEHKIKEYLPISKENIKRSSIINKIMKKIINHSFMLFFIVTYFRSK